MSRLRRTTSSAARSGREQSGSRLGTGTSRVIWLAKPAGPWRFGRQPAHAASWNEAGRPAAGSRFATCSKVDHTHCGAPGTLAMTWKPTRPTRPTRQSRGASPRLSSPSQTQASALTNRSAWSSGISIHAAFTSREPRGNSTASAVVCTVPSHSFACRTYSTATRFMRIS